MRLCSSLVAASWWDGGGDEIWTEMICKIVWAVRSRRASFFKDQPLINFSSHVPVVVRSRAHFFSLLRTLSGIAGLGLEKIAIFMFKTWKHSQNGP